MQLILVRHALPERVQDVERADPQLTELGHQQAKRLVGALSGDNVSALYASPLARARQTAAPLGEPRILDGLREYDSDASHYVPVHEMAEHDPVAWERMLAGLLPAHVDVAAFTARADAALEGIVAAHPGRASVVVVAHAGVINVWLAHLLGIEAPLAFPLDYTGITRVLAGRDGRRVVRSVNEIAHVADLLQVTAGAG